MNSFKGHVVRRSGDGRFGDHVRRQSILSDYVEGTGNCKFCRRFGQFSASDADHPRKPMLYYMVKTLLSYKSYVGIRKYVGFKKLNVMIFLKRIKRRISGI
jgi:hypothetical protein